VKVCKRFIIHILNPKFAVLHDPQLVTSPTSSHVLFVTFNFFLHFGVCISQEAALKDASQQISLCISFPIWNTRHSELSSFCHPNGNISRNSSKLYFQIYFSFSKYLFSFRNVIFSFCIYIYLFQCSYSNSTYFHNVRCIYTNNFSYNFFCNLWCSELSLRVTFRAFASVSEHHSASIVCSWFRSLFLGVCMWREIYCYSYILMLNLMWETCSFYFVISTVMHWFNWLFTALLIK
jgi:hypothetical protein